MNIKVSKKILLLMLTGALSLSSCSKTGEMYKETELERVENNTEEQPEDIKMEKVKKIKEKKEKLKIEKENIIVADTNVNIRKEADSTSDKLGQLVKSDSLKMKQLLENGWYEVEYNNDKAYINKDYVHEDKTINIKNKPKKVVYFDSESVLYKDKLFNKIVEDIPRLESATIYFEDDNYYLAEVDNKVGYIKKENIVDLNGKFVIVDISNQIARLYDGTEIILETPVITGKPSTPTDQGIFEIQEITRNRYLYNEDGTPNVWVDVMMKFNGNEGLHDAEYHNDYDGNGNLIRHHGWKATSSFGGQTHLYNGSHGCVNMLHDAAIEVYNQVEVGTKVLVKE